MKIYCLFFHSSCKSYQPLEAQDDPKISYDMAIRTHLPRSTLRELIVQLFIPQSKHLLTRRSLECHIFFLFVRHFYNPIFLFSPLYNLICALFFALDSSTRASKDDSFARAHHNHKQSKINTWWRSRIFSYSLLCSLPRSRKKDDIKEKVLKTLREKWRKYQ